MKLAPDKEIDPEKRKKCVENMRKFMAKNKLQQAVAQFVTAQLISNHDKEEIVNTFKSMDTNKDGLISKEELLQFYKNSMVGEKDDNKIK